MVLLRCRLNLAKLCFDTIWFWFSCGCCTGYFVLIVYLAIFAFNNPNMPVVYGIAEDGAETLFHSIEAAEEKGADDLKNVHSLFFSWFLWGFIQMLCLIPCMGCTGFGMIGILEHRFDCISVTGCCSCTCCCCCPGVAWYIMGLVWRCS